MIQTSSLNQWEKEKNEPLSSAHAHNLLPFERVFLFLLFLLFPTQLGRHFWPPFTTVLGIRVDYLSPTLYLTDLLIIILFVFSLWRVITNHTYPNLLQGSWKFFALLLLLLLGIMGSREPLLGLYGMLRVIECLFLFWYFTTMFSLTVFGLIRSALIIGISGESLLALTQYVLQRSVGGPLYWLGERTFSASTPGIATASLGGELVLRPYGTFPHPNVLAAFLLCGMVFLLGEFLNRRQRILAIPFMLGSIGLALTFSRMTLLLAFVFGVAWVMSRKRKAIWMTVIVGGGLLASLFTPLAARFVQTSLFEESVTVRLSLMDAAFRMLSDHPLVGVGVHQFLVSLPTYQAKVTGSFFTALQPVHNIFLLIGAETGLIGLGLFLWLLVAIYTRIVNYELRMRNHRKKNLLQNPKFLLVTSVCILGFFDHYFITIQQGRLLLVFILSYAWVLAPDKAKIPKMKLKNGK